MEYKKKTICSMIAMEKVFSPCNDFKQAMKDWIDMGYNLDDDIDIKNLIKVAERCNGVSQLISKGFIEQIKENVTFYTYLKKGDKNPVVRLNNDLGDVIIDCSVLERDKQFRVRLSHLDFEVIDNKEIIFTYKRV